MQRDLSRKLDTNIADIQVPSFLLGPAKKAVKAKDVPLKSAPPKILTNVTINIKSPVKEEPLVVVPEEPLNLERFMVRIPRIDETALLEEDVRIDWQTRFATDLLLNRNLILNNEITRIVEV